MERSTNVSVIGAVAVLATTLFAAEGSGKTYVPPNYLADVLTLNTANYTGGLNPKDIGVAKRIQEALRPRYSKRCDAPSAFEGVLIGLGDSVKKPLPSLDGLDPDLAFLIRALDHPRQEVRDVAAYTIGLLGPAATAARPFLEAKFDAQDGFKDKPTDLKSGWYNLALERVSCQQIVSPSVTTFVPGGIREKAPFVGKSDAYVIASLYLDPTLTFPPGVLEKAASNAFREDDEIGPLLVRIIENDSLGVEKQIEAVAALPKVGATHAKDVLPALLRLADTSDPRLRYYVTYILVQLGHERAIDLVAAGIEKDDWEGGWARSLCSYGHRAVHTENKLIDLATGSSTWPRVATQAIETLGCVGSVKAVALLVALLESPDWTTSLSAAKALGDIGQRNEDVISALDRLSTTHWSGRVRRGAFNALVKLGAKPAPPPITPPPVKDGVERIFIGSAYPLDHGLAWCDEKGLYSIDGKNWFKVKWIEPTLESIPEGFRPKTQLMIQTVGTHSFLRVDDGWLFGSDGFESEGVLAHVSDSGVVTEMEKMEDEPRVPFGHASIRGIVRVGAKYFALGHEILKIGEAGVLFELRTDANGSWTANRAAILPSPPRWHSIATSGELLLSDGPNDYAIVENQIVPLKCEKTFSGSYFDGR